MVVTDDLRIIARQERELVFPKFDEGDAWQLGQYLREWGHRNKAPIAIDIRTFNRPLFFAALSGSAPDNIDWIRRKCNVVDRYRRSSYALGLEMAAKNSTLADRYGLPLQDYASHGESFPLTLDRSGVIGSITVSGLEEREDHMLVVTAICETLSLDVKCYDL
ncbi:MULTISPECIES: heme-degrading domain-containing protein [unclassified Gluconobacter]|uniref:heme-degrading domain-containing protein n=1 Tax=unclassified Gluconobacter TaxID=2644261 RepID=UPI001C04AC05|nr:MULTISPECIES: heme-degrading domain-containing protein [unclassified Gluconobacter]